MNLRKLKNQAGFTLVELIVVIAIMAILAGVAVPVYSGYIEKAEKAGDLQLLGAVNSAFGAAIVENGSDIYSVNNAALSYGGSEGAVTVTGVSSVTGTGLDTAKVNESFTRYYAGNEGAVLKVTAQLKFNTETHLFEIYSMDNVKNAVNVFNKSNFAGKTDVLAGSVDYLSGMLADKIGEEGAAELLQDHLDMMGEGEYEKFLAKYGLNENSTDAEYANASIMYVADQLSGLTANDIKATMGTDPNNIVTAYGTIPTAAMMYGLMTGYANSSYGANYTLNEPTTVSGVLGDFMALYSEPSFQQYFGSEEKGGMADLDGFLASMDVINAYEGNFDLSDENLFVSEESTDLLNSILKSNS